MMTNALAVPVLTARAGRINAATAPQRPGRSMLAYAVEAGRELLEVKRGLGYGEFQPWVSSHCEFNYRTAARYMAVAKSNTPVTFEGGYAGFLEVAARPRKPSELPQFTRDDAEKVLKVVVLTNSDNANEEAVAEEMLDRMASVLE